MCRIQAGIQAGRQGAAGNKTGQGRMSKHEPVTRGHVPITKAKMTSMTGLILITTTRMTWKWCWFFYHKLSYDGHILPYPMLDSWSIWPSHEGIYFSEDIYASIWPSFTGIYFCKEYIPAYDGHMPPYGIAWDMGADDIDNSIADFHWQPQIS
jgi:hypothetical protein